MAQILAAALLLAALAAAPAVGADEGEPAAPDTRPQFEGALGLQFSNAPQYQGSDKRQSSFTPGTYLRWGRFSISTAGNLRSRHDDEVIRGIGAELVRRDDLRVQLGLRIDRGRKTSVSPELARLDEVRPTLRGRLTSSWRFERDWRLGAGWSADLFGRGGGSLVDLSVTREIRLGERTELSLGAGLSWADQRYMMARFGIRPEAAARSGMPAYEPGAGWRDLALNMQVRVDIDRRWAGWGSASLGRLLGPTIDSPLTRQVSQVAAGGGLVWRF